MNDAFCFGFFRERKIRKVPFSLQEPLSFTKDFKKTSCFHRTSPPKLSLEIVSSSGETLFKIYKLGFVSVLITWKMEKNKRSYEKQMTDNPRSFE